MPISDITHSFKITKSCKNLEHEFMIVADESTKEEWSLQASAYAPFFCRQGEIENKMKIKQMMENSVRIDFGKWILPGSGYVITLKKKMLHN